MKRYRLHGLEIRSGVLLPAPLSPASPDACDLVFRPGPPAVGPSAPTGETLARFELRGRLVYTLAGHADGYALTFHRTGRFLINPDLREVEVRLFPGVPTDRAGLILSNGVIAAVLALRGEWVLHAGAVEAGGRALAFVGGIGAGKSTLTAAFCALGARIVTDDLLRLAPEGESGGPVLPRDQSGGCRCFRGTGRLRLRKDAVPLARALSGARERWTSDGRLELALPLPPHDHPLPELLALVIPRPSRKTETPELQRLSPARAAVLLHEGLKMPGVLRRRDLESRLAFAARLAARLPVFEAAIPWGIHRLREVALILARELGFPLPEEVFP